MPPAGRPSTYDPEVADAICSHIEHAGVGLETASELEGIPEPTARLWKKNHPEFLRATKKAKALWVMRRAEKLNADADTGDTTAGIYLTKARAGWTDRPPAQTQVTVGTAQRLIVATPEDPPEDEEADASGDG